MAHEPFIIQVAVAFALACLGVMALCFGIGVYKQSRY